MTRSLAIGLAAVLAGVVAATPALAADPNPFAPLDSFLTPTQGWLIWIGRLIGLGMLAVVAVRSYFKGFDWGGLGTTLLGVAIIILATPLANFFAASASPPSAPSVGGGGGANSFHWACQLCEPIMDRLDTSLRNFRAGAYRLLAAPAYSLARVVVTLKILLWGIKVLMNPDEGRNALPRFASEMWWSLLAFGLLSAPDFVTGAVVRNVEQAFLNTSALLLQSAQGYFTSTQGVTITTNYDASTMAGAHPYSHLWANVEATIMPLATMFFDRIHGGAGAILDIGLIVCAIVLCIPFIFVGGVFIAFMTQTIFYVAAVTALAPIFIAGLSFQAVRSMLFSGLRFAMNGGVTLLVAAVAMGITGTLIVDIVSSAGNIALAMKNAELSQALANAADGQATLDSLGIPNPVDAIFRYFQSWTDSGNARDIAQRSFLDSDAASAILDPTTRAFWLTLGAGAVSVLLHLAAPRIASTFMGVTDSATTAGIVVAATQALGGFALAKTMQGGRNLFGLFGGGGNGGGSGNPLVDTLTQLNDTLGRLGGGAGAAAPPSFGEQMDRATRTSGADGGGALRSAADRFGGGGL